MIGSDVELCFSEKEGDIDWKDYIERFMTEENDLDHNMEGDAVEGPVDCGYRDIVVQALSEVKTRSVHGSSDLSLELIATSWYYEFA